MERLSTAPTLRMHCQLQMEGLVRQKRLIWRMTLRTLPHPLARRSTRCPPAFRALFSVPCEKAMNMCRSHFVICVEDVVCCYCSGFQEMARDAERRRVCVLTIHGPDGAADGDWEVPEWISVGSLKDLCVVQATCSDSQGCNGVRRLLCCCFACVAVLHSGIPWTGTRFLFLKLEMSVPWTCTREMRYLWWATHEAPS